MTTESVYEDSLEFPTSQLDIHVVKNVEGDCSFTETPLDDELATLVASVDIGFIFISREFVESEKDPVELERFRSVISEDEEDEEDSPSMSITPKTTLEEFVDPEEDDEEDEDGVERISCAFCSYITETYLRCTVYKTRALRARDEEKFELVGVDNSNRLKGDGLYLCTHCVNQLREETKELVDGLELALAINNI